jgi:hypothetical protein
MECIYALGQEALLGIHSDGFLFGDFPISAKGGGGIVPAIFVAKVDHVDEEAGGDTCRVKGE